MKIRSWMLLGLLAVATWWVICQTRRETAPAPTAGHPAPTPVAASPVARTTSSLPAAATAASTPAASALAAVPRLTESNVSSGLESLGAFRQWSERFMAASPEERVALTAEGVAVAQARRPVLKQLIRDDPRRALAEAVPMVVRQELPAEVMAWLEERVNGRGALRVYQGVGLDNASPVSTVRVAEFESGRAYEAHVYGRRQERVLWLAGASLNGVALDQEFAVHEDPFRTLEVGERPNPNQPAVSVCPVSGRSSLAAEDRGQPITEETPAVEAFGEIIYLCNGTHAIVYKEQLIYAEGGTGGPQAFTGILPAAPTPSIGNVKVLVIPMTFADQNDTPSSESTLYQVLRDVGDHYAKASYGKLTLLTTVTPPVKLPHNEAWYIQKDTSNGGTIDGLGLEHSHARAEARALGFDDEAYDCVVVRLRGGPRPAGGYGGGDSVWIYGDGVDVTAHEIGHAFGLAHANFWDTAGTSAIGSGANGEYGGHWDVMGGIGLPYGHYNAQGKNQIKWLPNAFVTEITGSGLYRIYAQDQAILDPALRFALKIRKDSLRTYWGELRGLYTGHATRTWADYGLILGWRFPGAGGSNIQLIDTTPGSPFAKDDSPISLGRTFSDTEAGIHITTVAVTPASADQPKSVDVVVNLGDFAGNQPPTLTLTASSTVVPQNVPVTFTATASDPDGDMIAYAWQHFGDSTYRTVSPNAAVISRSFPNAGSYVVTCTVSDMKGGTAIRSQLVTVGNGGTRYTIRGRVTLNGQGLAGVLVNANSANGVITDSDGAYTIPNLAAGTYVMTPLLYGYTFTELFNNSVIVGPDFSDADFEAAPTPRLSIAASTPTTSETPGASPGQITLTRTGDPSQPLIVNVLGPLGSATLTSDFSINPAPGSGSQGFGTLTFPADQDTLTVSFTAANDTAAEGLETVTLELGPGNGYVIEGTARASVVIDDNDTALPKVSLAVGQAKTVEASPAPASIRVTRTGSTAGPLTVPYAVSGSASSGTDFVPLPGSVLIPAGATSASVEISSVNNPDSESLENVILQISSSASLLADPLAATATVEIVDDDVQTVTVMATDGQASERDLSVPGTVADTATFLITRQGDLTQPLTVYYAVAGMISGSTPTALHGVDYEALPGVLLIPTGQSSGAVTIIPRWDGLGEGAESVTLQLGAGPTNYRLGESNTASITINDANDPPYVEVLGVDNAVEGTSPTAGRFRFSLKGSIAGNVTVFYTVTGTATSGTDFSALPGSISIPGNGVNTAEVTVTPINDASPEDLETLTLTLTPNAAYQVFAPSRSATLWLRDDDQPTLFVDANVSAYPPSIAETSASGGSFYVSRVGSTNAALAFTYAVAGSASNGADYQTLNGSTNIPAGALGVEIPVRPINDALAEGTETITLSLLAGAYGRGAPATLYLTDDETPAAAVGFAQTGGAGSESAGTVNIPVTLSAGSAAPVTVEYRVDSGTAASSTADGTAPSPLPYWVRCDRLGDTLIGMISVDGVNWTGVSTQTVALPSTAYLAGLYVCSFNSSLLSTGVFDNVVISNLSPGGTQGARTGATIGSMVIAGSASVSGPTYTVAGAGDNVEGTTDQGYYTYWQINNSANCTITARVVAQSNTSPLATAGVMIRESTANNVRRGYMAVTPGNGFEFHYRATSGAAETKVTSPPPPRPLWVRLQRSGQVFATFQSSDGSSWTQVGASQPIPAGQELLAGLTISSQSEGTLATAAIDNVSLTPGPLPPLQGRTVGFTATQGTDQFSSGTYTMSGSGDGINGTSDDCYFLAAPVSGDFVLSARITSLVGGAGSPQAGVMMRENTGRHARMVYLGGFPGGTPRMAWRTSTTTSAQGAGLDWTLPPGVLTFPPGSTSQNITLTVTNDALPEPDEVLMVILRNASGARLDSARSQFAYAIVDDDSPPALPFAGFAAQASTTAEADHTVLVPVTLSIPPSTTVTLDYAINPGTAAAGDDFLAATGVLTFAPGDTVQFVPVSLLSDSTLEPDETVILTLPTLNGAQAGTLGSHTLSIVDDDRPVVTVASPDSSASEGGDDATVVLTRSGATGSPLTVNLTRSGTAAVSDYSGLATTADFLAGESSITLTLAPVQDALAEGSETVIVTVAAGAGYAPGTPAAVTLTILDDDRNTVSIGVAAASLLEGQTGGALTLTRHGNTNSALNVSLNPTGTATRGTDYTTVPAAILTVQFAAGETSRTITVNAADDLAIEGDEAILFVINAGAYDIEGLGYASIVIQDNDVPPSVFISSPGAQGVVIASTNGVEFAATASDDGLPQPLNFHWTQVTGPGTVNFTATNRPSAPATFSLPGTYLVRVSVSDGQFSASDQITINVGGTNTLVPADWLSTDIGPTTYRGYSGVEGDAWMLVGAGTGYTSSSDRAHAVTRQISGNGTIVARLATVSGPTNSEAGVSIRDSLHRYSRRAVLVYQAASRTLRFRQRITPNTTDTFVSVGALNLPLWLKLERVEATDVITAFYAADVADAPGPWIAIGSPATLAMDVSADYSLTTDSGNDSVPAIAVFDHVALTPPPAGHASLAEDFGGNTQEGTYAYDALNDIHTLMGKGSLDGSGMFWGQTFTGDFILTVLQTNATSGASSARSGIMIRDSMDDGAMAFVGRIPTGSYNSFVWRTNPKGGTGGLNGITQRRRWLRFQRRGNQITALHAPDNNGVPGAWVQIGQPQTVFLNPTVLAGLYCDNSGGVGLNTATFTRFSVVPLNRAPIVNPGTAPAEPASPLSLFGRVTDDGLPVDFVSTWSVAAAPGPVTFGNSNALFTTAAFSVPGPYTLRLWADDTMARTFDDVSFSVPGSGFPLWQAAHFPGGATNPDAAPHADPDGDQLDNAGEYAFGTDPNAPNPNPILVSLVPVGDAQYLQVTVPKNPEATDATITVQAGDEISPPSWSADGLVTEENTAVLLRVRDGVPTSAASKRFMLVHVELPF